MEELFENKTKYSQKEYDIFLKAYREEFALSEKLYMTFYFAFFGVCMVLAFKVNEILLGFALLFGLLVYGWYKLIRPIKRAQKDKKSEKIKGNFINTYKFYKNYFRVKNPEGEAQIFYYKLYKVVETNSHYYIYLSREAAFIVSKNGFTKGNNLEFSDFLKKKVLLKYKKKMKDSKKT